MQEQLKLGKIFIPNSVKALRKVPVSHKATTGLGVDGFHPKLPLDLSDECHERIVMLLHEV